MDLLIHCKQGVTTTQRQCAKVAVGVVPLVSSGHWGNAAKDVSTYGRVKATCTQCVVLRSLTQASLPRATASWAGVGCAPARQHTSRKGVWSSAPPIVQHNNGYEPICAIDVCVFTCCMCQVCMCHIYCGRLMCLFCKSRKWLKQYIPNIALLHYYITTLLLVQTTKLLHYYTTALHFSLCPLLEQLESSCAIATATRFGTGPRAVALITYYLSCSTF